MRDEQRAILAAVAAGRLSPEEAAERLEAADAVVDPERPARGGPGGAGTGAREEGDPGASSDHERPRLLRVQAAGRHLRVIGDDAVDVVDVDGLHEARREGDALVVTAQRPSGEGGFSFVGPPFDREWRRAWRDELRSRTREARRATREAHRSGRWSGDRSWEWQRDVGPWGRPASPSWPLWVGPLVVRVNPDLAVEVDLTAGSCTVSGLRGPTRVDISAGTATLKAMEGPLDLRAQAASVRVGARLTEGHSQLRCDAGSVVVALDARSDVTVRARTELGRVRLRRGGRPAGGGAGVQVNDELVVGQGTATLQVEAVMGSIDIRVEDGDAEPVPW